MPRLQMALLGSRWIGSPCKRMLPWSGANSPAIRLNRVVFPAPFGPMSPVIWPCSMLQCTPCSASSPPKRFVTSQTSSSFIDPCWCSSCQNSRTPRYLSRFWYNGQRHLLHLHTLLLGQSILPHLTEHLPWYSLTPCSHPTWAVLCTSFRQADFSTGSARPSDFPTHRRRPCLLIPKHKPSLSN